MIYDAIIPRSVTVYFDATRIPKCRYEALRVLNAVTTLERKAALRRLWHGHDSALFPFSFVCSKRMLIAECSYNFGEGYVYCLSFPFY